MYLLVTLYHWSDLRIRLTHLSSFRQSMLVVRVIHGIQTNWACRIVSMSYFYQLKLCYPWGILCFSPPPCSFEQQVTEGCLIPLLMVLKSLMKSLCAFSAQIQCVVLNFYSRLAPLRNSSLNNGGKHYKQTLACKFVH